MFKRQCSAEFSQHRDLQLAGLKCLRRMIVPSDIEMFLIPLKIHSDIQNAMRFFESEKEIQDICCLVISKICAAKMMDVNLQDDIHFMIKKYSKDKVIQQGLITTLVSFGKHFPCDERLVGLKAPVFIQRFMKTFSDEMESYFP
eukprot:Awhi_evm1s8127